jgi:hypothetical protein
MLRRSHLLAAAAVAALALAPMALADQGDARSNVIRIPLGRGQNVTIPAPGSERRTDAPYALTGDRPHEVVYRVVIRPGARGESTPVLIGDRY